MKYDPLSRDELKSVIDGVSCTSRIPMLYHFWISPQTFKNTMDREQVENMLHHYPFDAQFIPWRGPEIFEAPPDDPEYRWVTYDKPAAYNENALDEQIAITDWNQLDGIIKAFPKPDYPGMFINPPKSDGRYRVGHWWYTLFERHWSLRGMTNALTDYYTHPVEVHRLFRALTDFYLRIIERCKDELQADAVYITDDLGTQKGPFFSSKMFDEFYAPYYREMIDRAHHLDMHFWLHTCGNVEPLLPRLIELGVDVIHPIQKYAMDEKRIMNQYGGEICFQVGFDVQKIIPFGSAEEVRQEVHHLINTFFRKDGLFMLTAGNGITEDTPVQSLQMLFEESIRYGMEKVERARA
jgi:uroporphyrinogen decarboxylase